MGHKFVKPWFIRSSGLGSRQAAGFTELSCLGGKGKGTKGKQYHQNSKWALVRLRYQSLIYYIIGSCQIKDIIDSSKL